ncbi:hypothetical protein ATJ93_0810 [Halopiger aswanensis]|uniref:Uncharacterized protein n=2 Tax=Halopiger aswanensis TaxID=148449 RepID=A0A3R7HZQ9_9EURY|nr:hypothetical protein ATJ93_0810 [Halopiger aswanensis]
MVRDTIHVDKQSTRKQLTMEAWAADYLNSDSSMTKGLAANEALLFDFRRDLTDPLTEIEGRVLNRLSERSELDFRELLNRIISERTGQAMAKLQNECRYDDPEERLNHVDCYLIESQMPDGRGLGDEIADSIRYLVASPWDSRTDRLNDLQRLDRMFTDGVDAVDYDDSSFLTAIVEGDTSTWAVGDLHEAVVDREPWNDPDLTVEDLRNTTYIPEGRKRRRALDHALSNSSQVWDESDIRSLIKDLWEVHDLTVDQMINDLDYDPGSAEVDGVKFAERVQDLAEDLVSEMRQDDRWRDSVPGKPLHSPAQYYTDDKPPEYIVGLIGSAENILNHEIVESEEDVDIATSQLTHSTRDTDLDLVEEMQDEFEDRLFDLRDEVIEEVEG